MFVQKECEIFAFYIRIAQQNFSKILSLKLLFRDFLKMICHIDFNMVAAITSKESNQQNIST